MKFPVAVLISLCILTGCASSAPAEYGGRWRPVNRFSDTPQPIPLYQVYEFYASPLDATLKGMLTRWADDNQMKLAYEAPNDYTLYSAVADLRTHDINDAMSRLSTLYGDQGIGLSVESNRIVVRAATPAATEASPAQQ